MKRAVVRADGSSELGMGHIIRGLAFADGLREEGVESVFATKILEPRIADQILARGYPIREIPSEATSLEDAERTLTIAGGDGANLIVTDVCHRVSLSHLEELTEYHQMLGDNYFTVALAGEDVTQLPVQILVNPYFRTDYPVPTADAGRTVLLGPSYAIFGLEFREAAHVNRHISAEGHRVLVSIGGSDSLGFTAKAVKAVRAIPRDDLSLWIILGPAFSDDLKSRIESVLAGFGGELTVSDHDAKMSEAMLWADLAVTGDGLTKYETAVTGTPSVMLSRFDSPKALNEDFENAGTTRHLGDGNLIEVDDLAREIQVVLANASLRTSMSRKGKAMVDGRGLERVISRLPPDVFI